MLVVWNNLSDIISVFDQTLNNKKEFLSSEEINELENIFLNYKRIKRIIRNEVLLIPMRYGEMYNHPDENYLK